MQSYMLSRSICIPKFWTFDNILMWAFISNLPLSPYYYMSSLLRVSYVKKNLHFNVMIIYLVSENTRQIYFAPKGFATVPGIQEVLSKHETEVVSFCKL